MGKDPKPAGSAPCRAGDDDGAVRGFLRLVAREVVRSLRSKADKAKDAGGTGNGETDLPQRPVGAKRQDLDT
jgi:hypothetical protein